MIFQIFIVLILSLSHIFRKVNQKYRSPDIFRKIYRPSRRAVERRTINTIKDFKVFKDIGVDSEYISRLARHNPPNSLRYRRLLRL